MLTHYRVYYRDHDRSADPGVTSEFAGHLAGRHVPKDHRLVRAARTQLAVVEGTVGGA